MSGAFTGLPVLVASGGRTKWNRTRFAIPKTHAFDALCVGTVEGLRGWSLPTLVIKATGRGRYQRTRVTASGFLRGILMRQKGVHGFLTGDLVRAVVPSGKKLGIGSFNIQKLTGVVQGISYRHCRVLMHGDGYTYQQKHSLPPRPEGRGLSEN